MYKITFFVPATHVDEVKLAMFNQGAGKLGHYQHCAWQTLGEGQFMPHDDAQPFIGEKGKLEKVAEYVVQMVCSPENIRAVIAALKVAHPYEEPAYDITKIEDVY